MSYTEKALELLKEVKQSFVEEDWTFVLEQEDVILEKKDFLNVCPIPRYRIDTVIDKKSSELVDKIWNTDYDSAKVDDPDIIDWNIIDSGDDWKVIRQTNKMPWPVWTRESVVAQVKIVDGETVWIVAFSVEHKNAPRDDYNYVRTNVCMSVYGFTDCDDKTEAYRMAQIDPCGAIPVYVVNSYAGKLVDVVNSWKK